MSVQSQPDSSPLPRSDLGSREEDRPEEGRQEASEAPDAHHLWLVSEEALPCRASGWGPPGRSSSASPGPGPSMCSGTLVAPSGAVAGSVLEPVSGELGLCCHLLGFWAVQPLAREGPG